MSELAAPARKPTEGAKSGTNRGFRPDIQGLRAIAVTMVVIYHLYPNALPGGFAGVDVFFVISGYLITGHLWRGYAKTGKVSLVDFWGRRARRLVPAAALVLAVTWIMSRLILPATQLAQTAQQILASALYFQNWQLAHNAVDYLQSTTPSTPVQHFWSLSVEEQFYLVWPLLFLLAAAVALLTKRGERARRVVVGCLTTALVIASLAYSVWYTKQNPSAAYFVTTTRMWELGIGGLLAIAPPAFTRVIGRQGWLAWLGLAAVVASCFCLSGSSPFPGYLALLPVLGATAMIAGGSAEGRFGPWRLTSARPMVFIGGISYSLYLWHYPVINLFTAWHGHEPGLVTGPVLAGVSVVLAWLTKELVEDRVRLSGLFVGHGWRSVSTALAAALPVALVVIFIAGEPAPWQGRLGPGYPGAALLAAKADGAPPPPLPAKPILPPPNAVALPSYWANGCLDGEHVAAPKPCVYGDTKDPVMTVALVGDSIAGNWEAALNVIAKQEHWKLVTDLHANCAWTAASQADPDSGGPYPSCDAWGRAVTRDLITKIKPQLVITTSRGSVESTGAPRGPQSRAAIGAGEAQYWNQLEEHGIPVIAIAETPDLGGVSAPSCVEQYGASAPRCSVPRGKAITPQPPTSFAVKLTDGKVPLINMNNFVCTTQSCPAVIGNVLVYFDSHHFTQSYSQTLAPFLKQRLLATGVVPSPAAS